MHPLSSVSGALEAPMMRILPLSQYRAVIEAEMTVSKMTGFCDTIQAHLTRAQEENQRLQDRVTALESHERELTALHREELEAAQRKVQTAQQSAEAVQATLADVLERTQKEAAVMTAAKVTEIQAATAAGVARVAAVQGDLDATRLENQALRAQLTQQAETARVEREMAAHLADGRVASARQEVTQQMNTSLEHERTQNAALRRENDALHRLMGQIKEMFGRCPDVCSLLVDELLQLQGLYGAGEIVPWKGYL